MMRTYLKIALRAFRRQGTVALVNIGGLALGIAAAFVIGVYVHGELSYDRGFEHNEDIYRVATDFYDLGGFAKSQSQLLDYLPDAVASIDLVTRFNSGDPLTVVVDDITFEERNYLEVDSAFFAMFSYEFIEGDRHSALQGPGDVVISSELALTYFGTERALGKTMQVGEDGPVLHVTGVVNKPAFNTHLNAELWVPLETGQPNPYGWTSMQYYNYLRVTPGTDAAVLEDALHNLLETTIYPELGGGISFEDWAAGTTSVQFWVQPLTEIYLHSDLNMEMIPGGNATLVYILALIGLLILLIAGFNYVNLTTAASSVRVKEIGVKRSMGVERSALIQQFLMESVVFSLIAMVVAAGLAEGLLNIFNYVTGASPVESILARYEYLAALLVFSVGTGILAGLYPAFYLSQVKPVQLLKKNEPGASKGRVRKGLVVVQFTIAIILITGSAIVYNQLSFMKQADKGLDYEGVLVVNNLEELGEQDIVFKERIQSIPAVINASIARRVPTGQSMSVSMFQTPEMPEGISLERFRGDEDYLATLGFRLVEGRNFTGNVASDSTSIIVNESAVLSLGLGEEPLGKIVNQEYQVIGVVSDFNFQSLRTKIEPVVMQYVQHGYRMAVKVSGTGVSDTIASMEAIWTELNPENPLDYYYLDENFASLVAQEETLGRAIAFFTLLAVLIACMGLFGLTTYTIQRRTREIGIRKILGASVVQLVALLSSDFLRLVGIAFLVATPISYIAMRSWLNGFAYRMDLGIGVFLLAGALAAVLAMATLGYHALKASRANPVHAMRRE